MYVKCLEESLAQRKTSMDASSVASGRGQRVCGNLFSQLLGQESEHGSGDGYQLIGNLQSTRGSKTRDVYQGFTKDQVI